GPVAGRSLPSRGVAGHPGDPGHPGDRRGQRARAGLHGRERPGAAHPGDEPPTSSIHGRGAGARGLLDAQLLGERRRRLGDQPARRDGDRAQADAHRLPLAGGEGSPGRLTRRAAGGSRRDDVPLGSFAPLRLVASSRCRVASWRRRVVASALRNLPLVFRSAFQTPRAERSRTGRLRTIPGRIMTSRIAPGYVTTSRVTPLPRAAPSVPAEPTTTAARNLPTANGAPGTRERLAGRLDPSPVRVGDGSPSCRLRRSTFRARRIPRSPRIPATENRPVR